MDEAWEELKASLEQSESLLGRVWRADDGVDDALRRTCELYLRSDDADRREIRAYFEDKPYLRSYLIGYVAMAAHNISGPEGAGWLRISLAAASIEDLRTDFRDTFVSLGEAYVQAHENGIFPGPYLEEASSLSSATPSFDGQSSMRRFLERFESSTYFGESVGPPIGRGRG